MIYKPGKEILLNIFAGNIKVMKIPDIPIDEESRIDALESLEILDTLPEEKFDRITRLCCRVFDVPIALVSLVDNNRQWFKSCQGLDASETSRDISFCGHAILGNEVFVIPDTEKDARFSDNPLVLDDPHIRFYAGYPLQSVNGSNLGTLCIIDRKPREFTQQDIEALSDLGYIIEQEIITMQIATIDELTKISNRRGIASLMPHYLNFCKRQNTTASLIFIDLDNFKSINDKFGHAEGDYALSAFAEQMGNTFRQTDLLARLGGDEFVVLFSDTKKHTAIDVMDKFSVALKHYNQQAERGYDLSFSYGVVQFDPGKHDSIEALISEGDTLMYQHKKQKKSKDVERLLTTHY